MPGLCPFRLRRNACPLRIVLPSTLHSTRRGHRVFVSASGFNVVITGSTKGIGKALAAEFLKAGDRVLITSRDAQRVDEVSAEFSSLYNSQNLLSYVADVSKGDDVAQLASYANQKLGNIDIWINNAGSNAYAFKPLTEQTPEEIQTVVDTNALGVLLCCREALRTMARQPGGGHVFLMDGAGADGGPTPRFAAYGATKRSLEQLSKSLTSELRMAKLNDRIAVHNLSPGMVVTDLLMAGADTKVSRWFINRLAERPETVASNLVPRIRHIAETSRPLPAGLGMPSHYVRFLTKTDAYAKIAKGLLGVGKDRFVNE